VETAPAGFDSRLLQALELLIRLRGVLQKITVKFSYLSPSCRLRGHSVTAASPVLLPGAHFSSTHKGPGRSQSSSRRDRVPIADGTGITAAIATKTADHLVEAMRQAAFQQPLGRRYAGKVDSGAPADPFV
jgi:hypothetical protein